MAGERGKGVRGGGRQAVDLLTDCGPRGRSLTHTGSVRLPEDGDALPLAGPTVGDEGLAVAVLMDRTLAHVCYTRPAVTTTHKSNGYN